MKVLFVMLHISLINNNNNVILLLQLTDNTYMLNKRITYCSIIFFIMYVYI
jgi:hypothetical protein